MSKSIGKVVGSSVIGGLTGAGEATSNLLSSGGQALGLSGGSGSQTTTSTPNIPQYVADYQKQMFDRAQETAFGSTQGLQARQFADFSELQNQGFNGLSNLNQNAGMQGAQSALGQLQSMGFGSDRIDPMMAQGKGYNASLANSGALGNAAQSNGRGYNNSLSALGALGNAQGYGVQNAFSGSLGNAAMMGAAGINRGDIRNVQAQNFLQGDLGAYQNKFTDEVINQSLADNDRARQLQQQGINAQALSRGAFGGSRQAIAESENSRNFMDQQARTGAQLRAQGFDTAAALMQNDMNRGLQAQQANQSADFNTASQNAGFKQQANSQNQAAQNQFSLQRYGQEADTSRFNAANQNAANQFLANAQNQFGLERFGAQNAMNQFNASNKNAASQFVANARNNSSLANQQANNQFSLQRYAQNANTSQFNAANQTAASQFGADSANRAMLANQSAGLTAQSQNANNQLQAQQLRSGALSNALSGGLQLNNSFLGNLNAQMQGGAMQQDLQQQRLDALRNLPLERLGILSSTFTGGQLPYGQSQTSPVQKSNPFLGGLGGAATGAGLATAIPSLGLSAGAGAGLGALAAFL